MTDALSTRLHRVFCIAAIALWLVLGWPVLQKFVSDQPIRGTLVPLEWIVPFLIFGAALCGTMLLNGRPRLLWVLLSVELAAVIGMTAILPWAGMSQFLVIVAWQVAMATTPGRALAWVAFQTAAVVATLAQALNPDLCWVIGKAIALQLLLVLTGQVLRREARMARALAQTNRELVAAQSMIADTVRDAERLRISRELHDAWGHELTALGLQLEIASHVREPDRVHEHVAQAKTLARDLLAKVRDVVSTLREAEHADLKSALEALAKRVPKPAVHIGISADLRVTPDQAHALVRCAQEAVTNAVRHSEAGNLWLQVTADGGGVRLVARDDGSSRPEVTTRGSGLIGMRERLEVLGGRLAVRSEAELGFTVDAWLPLRTPGTA